LADISLHTSKLWFPRFRNLHLREQLLLQILLISIIAFSVAFFAVWELHRTKDLLTSVRDSSRPARSAQQLAKEIEHIYGLSEAYQLSFNQPEQRPAIYAEIEQSKSRLAQYQQESEHDYDATCTATMRSFLGSVELLRDSADKFKSLFDDSDKLIATEQQIATEAVERFRQRANNETTLEKYKVLTEITTQIQNMHNALMIVYSHRIFKITKEYEASFYRELEDVADNQGKKINALKKAHESLTMLFRSELDDVFEIFKSARMSLVRILENANGLSADETADLRKIINDFDELFDDPQQKSANLSISGNSLLRGKQVIWFRLNLMAEHILVARLEKELDIFVNSTVERIQRVESETRVAFRRALSASLAGLLAGVGLIICVVFVIDRNILRRLNGITQKMRALARGETVAVTGAEKSDELGEMARALQVFWKAELQRREFQYKLQHANKELQREVDDSIYVAQRIQNALLRGKVPPGPWLSDQALINRPCKLLGGDSYWLERFDDGYVVALIDCTGHGVPGAMMTIATSIYMSAILHQEDLRDPAQILLRLADHVQNSLFEKSDDVKFDAGFDGAVCFVDVKSQRLCYAGGGIPLIVLDSNSGEIEILKGNGFGIDRATFDSRLVNRAVELRPGLRFYLTSDGLVTQPDAPRGAGFGWTRLVKLLRETHHLSLAEQNERLWTSFREFSADTEQRDDVTVIAFAA
jgi:serine phosphatase RsbU (regulator of sigma subunit)